MHCQNAGQTDYRAISRIKTSDHERQGRVGGQQKESRSVSVLAVQLIKTSRFENSGTSPFTTPSPSPSPFPSPSPLILPSIRRHFTLQTVHRDINDRLCLDMYYIVHPPNSLARIHFTQRYWSLVSSNGSEWFEPNSVCVEGERNIKIPH